MAFFSDQENVVSAAMTAVQRLMEKHQVDPCSIGRYSCYCMTFVSQDCTQALQTICIFTDSQEHTGRGVGAQNCIACCDWVTCT